MTNVRPLATREGRLYGLDIDGFADLRTVEASIRGLDADRFLATRWAKIDGRAIAARRGKHDRARPRLAIDARIHRDGPRIAACIQYGRQAKGGLPIRANQCRGGNLTDRPDRGSRNTVHRVHGNREIAIVARPAIDQEEIAFSRNQVGSGNGLGCRPAAGTANIAGHKRPAAIRVKRNLAAVPIRAVRWRDGKSGRRTGCDEAEPLVVFDRAAKLGDRAGRVTGRLAVDPVKIAIDAGHLTII